MAASGNIGADPSKLDRGRAEIGAAGGPAVAETAKQFEELGKSPVDASVKLSEKTHYLTTGRLRADQSAGRPGQDQRGSRRCAESWADAIDQRTPRMVENLGLIETAWKPTSKKRVGRGY
jgi:phage-related minor tail protein